MTLIKIETTLLRITAVIATDWEIGLLLTLTDTWGNALAIRRLEQ